jgi:hypothetical protein
MCIRKWACLGLTQTNRNEIVIFWVIIPCSSRNNHKSFGGTECLHLQPEYGMAGSSETLIIAQKTTWRHNKKYSYNNLSFYLHENLKSQTEVRNEVNRLVLLFILRRSQYLRL